MQNSIDNVYDIDRRHVRSSFNLAAKKYDSFSLLQQTITDRLVESFDHIIIQPTSILDLGAGTGYGSRKLKQQFKKAQIYQVDVSMEMLKISRQQSPRFS